MARQLKYLLVALLLIPALLSAAAPSYDDAAFDKTDAFDTGAFDFAVPPPPPPADGSAGGATIDGLSIGM